MNRNNSIVVLPFLNISSEPENEYFSDGLTEEVINYLAKIKNLNVVSRTSSFYFKNKNIDIREIGKQLDVSMLLEGSVRKVANYVRITIQLINPEDGFHYWSETYNHTIVDIFSVQDKISLNVAEKIREHLGHFNIEYKEARKTSDVNAYELYLKSKFNFNKFQKENINLAIKQIEQAIENEPNNSRYLAAKGIYYSYLGLVNAIPVKKAFAISKVFAEKALELDKTNVDAHHAIGLIAYFFENDLNKMYHHNLLSLKYMPNSTDALMGHSMYAIVSENYNIALIGIEKAISLDPMSPTLKYYYAAILLRLNKLIEALNIIEQVLNWIPNHTNSYCLKGVILRRLKRYDEAIEHFKSVPTPDGHKVEYNSALSIIYAHMGNMEKAIEYLEIIEIDKQNFNIAYEENAHVTINILLGNFDLAFRYIEEDIKLNKYYLKFYKIIPEFDLLKNDARYNIFDKVFITKGKIISKISNKYLKSGLSEEKMSEINIKLIQYMKEQKPYLDSDINLKNLSDKISVSTNQLSQVINDKHNKNFFDFINTYRIDEMTELMKEPSNQNFTLLTLAYNSGFNSKSTFNSTFKKLTGKTPSEYFLK
ncbi:MAG: helix-turn-helix domain-containing protein [Candidatus Kapaibacterium sp.]